MKTFFVTGGAGFIGSALIRLLLESYPNHEVINFDALTYAGNLDNLADVDTPRYRFVRGDIADRVAVQAALPSDVDAIFHLAAESHVDRSILSADEFIRTNVLGTQVLLDAAREQKVQRFVHVSCYDEETRALTKDGLKNYYELREGDIVFSLNSQTGLIEEKAIQKVIVQDYEGDMIHFQTSLSDLKVTPNHRMYYQQKTRNGLSEIRWDEAQNILGKHFLYFPRGQWQGKKAETINLTGIGEVSAQELFYLCGVFIGDGFTATQTKRLPSLSGLPKREADEVRRDPLTGRFGKVAVKVGPREFVTSTSWRIFFDVPKKDKARPRLEATLNALGIKWASHENKSSEHIYLCSQAWTEFFAQFGRGFRQKHIPRWMLDYDVSLLAALFDGLIDSDGHYSASGNSGGRRAFSTSSPRLAQNIAELGIKLGLSPRITPRKAVSPRLYSQENRYIQPSTSAYVIHFRSENIGLGQNTWQKVPYQGVIWCVKVADNKNLIVERNGLLQFCGNTDEVMGSLPDDPQAFFTEASPYAPNSPYAASKAAAEHFVRAARETHGLETVITRCGNNYGPRQFPEKLIPLFIANALRDEALPVYGDGKYTRDWIYVDDHARGIIAAYERGEAGGIYNLGARNARPNLDVIHTLLDALGKPPTLIRYVKDRPGHDRRYALDPTKAETELNWQPAETWQSGLAQTVRWYADNQAWVERCRSGAYRDFYRQQYGQEAGV